MIPTLSWTSAGTPDYITREEVIDFASSVVQYISAGGLSTIEVNVGPNPSFSTININPTGNITFNNAPLLSAKSLGLSTNFQLINNVDGYGLSPAQTLENKDPTTNNMRKASALAFECRPNSTVPYTPNQKMTGMNQDGIYGLLGDSLIAPQTVPGLSWLGAPTNQFALTNISSINGQSPSAVTISSFTTLTGTTLNSQFVNSPALNNISSINGKTKLPPFKLSYTIPIFTTLPPNTTSVVGTIIAPYTFPPLSLVAVTVNVQIGSFGLLSPQPIYLIFGLRVGGGGAGSIQLLTTPLTCLRDLPGGILTVAISGLFPVTGFFPSNTIEILCYNYSYNNTITCQIQAPQAVNTNFCYGAVMT